VREFGWIEGQTIPIEYRWAEGRNKRYAEIASEFVRLNVDIIVKSRTSPARAAKQATTIIPIVFASAGDPVRAGLVASLARPRSDVTGLSIQQADLVGTWNSLNSLGDAMEINSGLRSILAMPWVYRLMAHILGIEANRQWFIDDVLCLRDGQKLVDVGCAPADILDRLPGVEYVGLDISDLAAEQNSFPGAWRIGRAIHSPMKRMLFLPRACFTMSTMTRLRKFWNLRIVR
jgi:ABC transporter substrate binding protein